MDVPKDQIATLIENGLYNSAQMLGGFLVSSPVVNAESSPHLKAESLVCKLNPQNEAAKRGLERLEKQMKGVDPDSPEEDEDNDIEYADGDQEEPELL